MIIPDFLREFKSDIERCKLEAIQIAATPTYDKKKLPIRQSKFLGEPFLPLIQEYPKNKFGNPLVMLAQINFAETPRLTNYPEKGIFQVFTSTMFWDLMDTEYYLYMYHEDIDQRHHTDFSFLTEELYDGLPINCEHSLYFSKKIEYGGFEDFRFDLTFHGKSAFDYRKGLSKTEQELFDNLFRATGHKIGGYAHFTQSDPRGHDPIRKNDLLLLQVDTDKEIMFGDAGVSNIFINEEDLKARDFSKAYFHWDCA